MKKFDNDGKMLVVLED